jgi:predicted butyrate kinase (DUF1464 family)
LLVKTSRFETSEGEPMIVGTIREITERQRVERTLKRQSERERLLGVIAQHLLQSMNPEELLQTTVDEVTAVPEN